MEDLIKKYAHRIYTKSGDVSLKTAKAIAIEAGLIDPIVDRSHFGYLCINREIIDNYGNATGEVTSIYKSCKNYLLKKDLEERPWLYQGFKTYEQFNREQKIKEIIE